MNNRSRQPGRSSLQWLEYNRKQGMYRVSKSVSFCYGHRLLNYQGKCRHLHGHNARAVITLESDRLDEVYGDNFAPLREVKRKWDPDNLFRLNHNIA